MRLKNKNNNSFLIQVCDELVFKQIKNSKAQSFKSYLKSMLEYSIDILTRLKIKPNKINFCILDKDYLIWLRKNKKKESKKTRKDYLLQANESDIKKKWETKSIYFYRPMCLPFFAHDVCFNSDKQPILTVDEDAIVELGKLLEQKIDSNNFFISSQVQKLSTFYASYSDFEDIGEAAICSETNCRKRKYDNKITDELSMGASLLCIPIIIKTKVNFSSNYEQFCEDLYLNPIKLFEDNNISKFALKDFLKTIHPDIDIVTLEIIPPQFIPKLLLQFSKRKKNALGIAYKRLERMVGSIG